MYLGMPSLIECSSLEKNAILCRQLGLDFIELNMNLPAFGENRLKDTDYFQEIAREYGIFYTIHLEEDFTFCDWNDRVTEAYLATLEQVIRMAGRLPVLLLNLHWPKGVYFTLPKRKVYLLGQYKGWYLQKVVRFRDLCAQWLAGTSLRISIENTDGYLPFQQAALKLLLENNRFGLTWDIGHSHSIPEDRAYLFAHQDRLLHFHFHDAVGQKNHLAFGSGDVDLKSFFSLPNSRNAAVFWR